MEALVEEIAQRYLRLVKIKEDFVGAACPFHKKGQENRPSFWIRKDDGSWGCFSCSERGKSLKTLLQKMGIRNRVVDETLKEFEKELEKNREIERVRATRKKRSSFKGKCKLPETLLGVFDWCPMLLIDGGFSEEGLKTFDIGFDKQRNRITFPIRDLYGSLIGISGRDVLDTSFSKYKVYGGCTLNDKGEVTSKGELGDYFPSYSSSGIRDHLWGAHLIFDDLYNGRCSDDETYLIIVEGYKACLWLIQHGWKNTVALMGSRMSATQERIVRTLGIPTWVFLDNDEAGVKGAKITSQRLGDSTFPVYCCQYPSEYEEGTQPDDLHTDEIETIITNASRATGGKHAHRKSEYAKHKKSW